MDLQSFHSLLTTPGQAALQTAQELQPREEDFLQHLQTLERRYPLELARSALEIAILRKEALRKFSKPEHLYFTREALEQASSEPVASYRALRYRSFRRVVDLGCSVGVDTLALAASTQAIGLDRDPLRLSMAQANARALGLSQQAAFLQADLHASLPFRVFFAPSADRPALFFDPARRSSGGRIFSVEDYSPPLSSILGWLESYPAAGVKISPGVKLEQLQAYDAEVEFISLRGDLKEAVLWFGPLKSAARRATVLPGPHSMEGGFSGPLPLSTPKAYLYEPDPSILRAGLVAALGARLDASQLDSDIAYLTSDRLVETPFARSWTVRDWFPFTLKRLRTYLRERRIGQVVIKKRGSPLEPERLQHELRLHGEGQAVVFLTHLRGRPIVMIGE